MKRIKVAPGKFIMISAKLAEKAARLTPPRAFTQAEMSAFAAMEAKVGAGPMLGLNRGRSRKPKRR